MTRIEEAIRFRRLSSVDAMAKDPVVRIWLTDSVLCAAMAADVDQRSDEHEQLSDLERSMLSSAQHSAEFCKATVSLSLLSTNRGIKTGMSSFTNIIGATRGMISPIVVENGGNWIA
jgi:hypothetical protein